MATIISTDNILTSLKQTKGKIPCNFRLKKYVDGDYIYFLNILHISIAFDYEFYIIHNSYEDICKVIEYISRKKNKIYFSETCIEDDDFYFIFTKEDCEQICKNFTKSFREKHNL